VQVRWANVNKTRVRVRVSFFPYPRTVIYRRIRLCDQRHRPWSEPIYNNNVRREYVIAVALSSMRPTRRCYGSTRQVHYCGRGGRAVKRKREEKKVAHIFTMRTMRYDGRCVGALKRNNVRVEWTVEYPPVIKYYTTLLYHTTYRDAYARPRAGKVIFFRAPVSNMSKYPNDVDAVRGGGEVNGVRKF
jgi:hypothetical protein